IPSGRLTFQPGSRATESAMIHSRDDSNRAHTVAPTALPVSTKRPKLPHVCANSGMRHSGDGCKLLAPSWIRRRLGNHATVDHLQCARQEPLDNHVQCDSLRMPQPKPTRAFEISDAANTGHLNSTVDDRRLSRFAQDTSTASDRFARGAKEESSG